MYCVIFRRPSSPSFDSRSRYGQTTVSSCRMIDELMYGITPSAKIVICDSAPPVNMSYRPNIVFCICCASSRQRLAIHARASG